MFFNERSTLPEHTSRWRIIHRKDNGCTRGLQGFRQDAFSSVAICSLFPLIYVGDSASGNTSGVILFGRDVKSQIHSVSPVWYFFLTLMFFVLRFLVRARPQSGNEMHMIVFVLGENVKRSCTPQELVVFQQKCFPTLTGSCKGS